jgi:regulator of protease activity HflC (stomatin/prohibitin superfamily)
MEAQASAERERKAMVTKAEGTKQSAILQAEARLESARRDADAMVTLAEASAEAIKRVSTAIGTQEAPMRYMLGEKYIAAMGRLADSQNAKTILLPADIQETLRGLLGRRD